MRNLVLLISFLLSLVFANEVLACGNKKYDLQTEVEIDGKITTPKFVAADRETVVSKTSQGGINTTVQVVAEELWDDKHQGDAVKLTFKVYQSEGRRTLLDSTPTIIARYNEPAEIKVTDDKAASKSLRLKVTAKKL